MVFRLGYHTSFERGMSDSRSGSGLQGGPLRKGRGLSHAFTNAVASESGFVVVMRVWSLVGVGNSDCVSMCFDHVG